MIHKFVTYTIIPPPLTFQQCVGQVPQLAHYKKSIESKFSSIKAACSAQGAGQPPRLTPDLQRWYINNIVSSSLYEY